MFKSLLVPLDGSRLAEAALPSALYLAGKLQASVTLLHVVEREAPDAIHGERHLTDAEQARAYLDEVAQRVFPATMTVERHVHNEAVSSVAGSLAAHQEELAPDLIVMCTHGHGSLHDVFMGNIAQQVMARGSTPVLLVRPDEKGQAAPFPWRRFLVPLDGAADHEQVLPAVTELARACQAEVRLLRVVPTRLTLSVERSATGRLLPGATTAILELAQQSAEAYLRERAERLQAVGTNASAQVRRGEPTGAIVKEARQAQADLLAFGTHRKIGMEAFWAGSIAAQVSSRLRLSILLVPLPANSAP
jgi:nucleotide-binding universal stress UspA family protein